MTKKSDAPAIRFKGFSDAWEQRKFSEITFLSGEKNRENLPLESYSITNESGFGRKTRSLKMVALCEKLIKECTISFLQTRLPTIRQE